MNACAALYETMSFGEITLRDIGEKTSFSRTSIYNYFQTKEEIFLALLQREHEAWIADLKELAADGGADSIQAFSDQLGRTLERRGRMLKLMAMNLYDMEVNSRLENLVAFKKVYAQALREAGRCLEAHFPRMSAQEAKVFLYAFFPFLFGVYPYTFHTEKQLRAMDLAQVPYPRLSIYQVTRSFVETMLQGILGKR